ncbi:MAG: hypothetical protein IPG04_15235 [Polyangiaceae bacterium]|nr:hypothetical protein [Polyangiaceae bacterium]
MAESAPLGDMEDSEVEFAGVRAGNVCSEAYRLAASGAMTPTRHEQYRETLRSFLEGHQLMSYLDHLDAMVDAGERRGVRHE